jgi:two-component system response regulator YesN
VLRFLSSYLLVLVLPLVIVSLINGKFITLMTDDARQANLSILEQCRDTLDGRLAEIGSMIASLSLNADIGSLIASTDSIDHIIMKVARAQRDLYPYIATNSFLSDFFIYLRNSNAILSPFTAYIRLENVYGGVIKYGDMDYAQFHTRLLNGYHSKEYLPSVPVMLDGKTRTAILCVQSIPLGFVSDVKANLLFFIDEERVRELLARLRIDEGGWAYIADREGRVLVSIGREREGIGADELGAARQKKIVESTYSGKKMIVSCTVSASNEWTYVAAVPYAVVMSRVEGVRRLSFFVVAGMVLAGFAASITLAFRSSKPLRNVMGLLEGSLGDCKYGQLEDSVSELISRNESMSKSAQEQLPILRSAFLDRLLRGEFASAREVEASMAQAGLSIGGSSYAVLLIRIDGYRESATREVLEELRLKKAAVREAFQSYFDGALLLHDVGAGSISALLCFEGQEEVPEEELEAEMRRAVGSLESERCIKVSLGMGRRYVDLVDVTSSYYEASEALERGSPGRIALYRDGEKNEGGYSYPIDRELRLMNLVKAGDGARAKELLDAIRAENASRGALSREVVSLFLFELRGTLTKLLALPGIAEAEWSAGMAASLGAIRHEEDLGTSFDAYAALFLAMCDAIGAQKKSHNSLMRTKMVERVKERFPDANFGLGAIADEFEVTEVYASQFFKEQTGENFSAYLERVRMEKARELLETTDITINDLAAKVGYNSAHAFRRAYKRVNGVIPTSLRDTRLGRNL